MADALLDNPPYENQPVTKSNLILAKGFASISVTNPETSIDLAMQAYRLNPVLDVAYFSATIVEQSGGRERAEEFLEERFVKPHRLPQENGAPG